MRIAIIGAGTMGWAIAEGLLRQDKIVVDLILTAASEASVKKYDAMGLNATNDNKAAASSADILILAVKPWLFEKVCGEIADVAVGKIIISVAAGVSLETLEVYLNSHDKNSEIAIAIPNTAAAFCQSMTFISSYSHKAVSCATEIFSTLGDTLIVDESHLWAGMALASCGIAYALRYIRAATEGGVELGFKASIAQRIVAQTVKGAVALLSQPGSHAESEIDKVTTAGGITIRGLNEMEHAGFTSAVIRGLKASVK